MRPSDISTALWFWLEHADYQGSHDDAICALERTDRITYDWTTSTWVWLTTIAEK